MSQALVIHIPQSNRLPDNAQWTNRFEIKGGSISKRTGLANVYTIAQHKTGGYWSCSCGGFILHGSRKPCRHLKALGLPGFHTPFEATLAAGRE